MSDANTPESTIPPEELEWLYEFFYYRGVISGILEGKNSVISPPYPLAIQMSLQLMDGQYEHKNVRHAAMTTLIALNRLEMYRRGLIHLAKLKGKNSEDAEDCAQAVLLRALRIPSLIRLLGEREKNETPSRKQSILPLQNKWPRIRAWQLLTMLLNQRLIDDFRTDHSNRSLNVRDIRGIELGDRLPSNNETTNPESQLLEIALREWFLQMERDPQAFGLRSLDARIARMYLLESMTLTEIASQMAIDISTASRSLLRTRVKLRHLIENI